MNPFMYGPMGFSPFGAMTGAFVIMAMVAGLWSLFWAGLSLWHAARNKQWGWFIALLLIHTVGILDLIYLFGFRANRASEPVFPWMNKSSAAKPASKEVSDLPVAESSPE